MVIVGGPRCGKTTRARQLAAATRAPVRHTDDLIGKFDWSGVSHEVSRWLDEPGPWVIEGVAAVRALRKWLAAHAAGKPCDRIERLTRPFVALTSGQAAMAQACETVWSEIADRLRARGVAIA